MQEQRGIVEAKRLTGGVSHDGVPNGPEMDTDLMGSACDGLGF